MSTPESAADSTTPRARTRDGLLALAMSAEGIYGLIVVAGMIVVSRNLAGTSAEALWSVVATLLVFFAAHVYASAASWLASDAGEGQRLAVAVKHGTYESAGLLVVGAVPIGILGLGVLGILRASDAVWLALLTDVVLLGVLGWFIAASRSSKAWVRVASVLLTAAFGGVLILLKALVHH